MSQRLAPSFRWRLRKTDDFRTLKEQSASPSSMPSLSPDDPLLPLRVPREIGCEIEQRNPHEEIEIERTPRNEKEDKSADGDELAKGVGHDGGHHKPCYLDGDRPGLKTCLKACCLAGFP